MAQPERHKKHPTAARQRARTRARVAYLNGKIVPESQALVSFRDRGFLYRDMVFDTTRAFGHLIVLLMWASSSRRTSASNATGN